jgi:hypothetical protein
LSGLSYYRLTQTDFDGHYTYSNIAAVNYKNKSNVEVYPNPTNDIVQIMFNGKEGQLMSIQIYDNKGSLVLSRQFTASDGKNNFIMSLSSLTAGMYCINITGGYEPIKKMVAKE